MLDRRIVALVREIRDLYVRNCALAKQYNAAIDADQQRLRKACRGRESAVRELNYFDSIFDRNEALRKAVADPHVRRRLQLMQVSVWLILFVVMWQSLMMFSSAIYISMGVAVVLALATRFLYGRFITASEPMRRNLRAQLIARGVPICLHCGYDLRGQCEPRCPECGQAAPIVATANLNEGGPRVV